MTDTTAGYTPPSLFRLSRAGDAAALAALERAGAVTRRLDQIELQLENLARVRTPERGRRADRGDVIADFTGGRPLDEVGVWVFYPWSGQLVHLLDEAEFVEMRTSANRNKLTGHEQALLRNRTVGVVGLSVGNAVALTIAAERSAGTIKVADFDELDLSNLNRLRATVADLGVNKAVLAARQIAEIDPYLTVHVHPGGLDEDSVADFFDGAPALDLLVEECDTPWVKIMAREQARSRRIPVLMECSDRGVLDVERFDLEPQRPLLHGLLTGLPLDQLRHADRDLELAVIAVIIGVDGTSDRIASSFVELDRTLSTWPQLASEVTHGGAVVATAARAILLGHDVPSGRRTVDLPFGIGRAEHRPSPTPTAAAESGGRVDDLPEDLREILELAMRSPSGGNTQQWRFLVRGRVIDVAHVPERSATHALFDCRDTVRRVVLGIVTESIVIAARARGLSADVVHDPLGPDDLVYTRITVGESGPDATSAERALGAALSARCSQRTLARGRALTEEERAVLDEAVAGFSARLWISGDEKVKQVYGEGVALGNRLRMLAGGMHRETFDEFYFRSEEPGRREGVPIENLQLPLPEQIALRLLRRPAVAGFLHERGEGRRLLEFSRDWADGASAVGAVTAGGSRRSDFVEAGRAVQRMWTAATAAGFGVHPTTSLMFEAEMLEGPEGDLFSPDERERIESAAAQLRSALLHGDGAPLALVFRLVAGTPAPEVEPSPRRPLSQHLEVLPERAPVLAGPGTGGQRSTGTATGPASGSASR
ncbi:Rv1355c family protein [Streptacidiphilus anmyonensis]|uniref:Rv1355c family protein n=1 Tax=Streptacidiphilus anmyonensis TaxID=405782 RepID=UPI0005A90402|nr:Rv1355c family protein [Streptacidiphilus anmyonensis]